MSEEEKNQEPLPPGEYVATTNKFKIMVFEDGSFEVLKAELKIIEGPFAGRIIFED